MSTIDDGGPAFPLKEPLTDDCPGMSLRDYFAAKAMAAMLGSERVQSGLGSFKSISEVAYVQADAMIAARESAQ